MNFWRSPRSAARACAGPRPATPYPDLVDPTLAAMLGGAVGLVIGAVAVAATRWSERSGAEARAGGAAAAPRRRRRARRCCAPSPSSSTPSDAVVNTSASAVSYGLVRHGELVHHRAAAPRPAGAPRRHDPRGRARAGPQPATPRRRVVMRVRVAPIARLARADPRRGPHPRPPGRGDPPRLRGQRQPRAEDPGRRHLAARRGGRSDAKDDPEAVERFAQRMLVESTRLTRLVQEIVDLSRLQVADTLHEPELVDVDAVVAEAVDRVRVAAEARDIELTAGQRRRPAGLRGCRAAHHRGRATWSTTRSTTATPAPGSASGPAGSTTLVEVDGHRPGPGHPRGRAGAHLRALLPGRRRPLARHRRHRPRAGHRQARLRRTTAAR